MERQHVSSDTEWEAAVGYSRAIRVGDKVSVSGTTATDEKGNVLGVGDPGAQTERAIANVERALTDVGATLEDVVRPRMYVADIDDWEAIGRAHEAALGDVRPTTSMVQVERLIDPELLVEIEAEAVVRD